ncbi:hypothetical protein ACPWR0_08540 [Pandoraea pneumonica]|uniref:hypothetical protein n=1 Tax=Pandoraea pneumonica TaxID=2508299 RepID=UPI003CEFC5AA
MPALRPYHPPIRPATMPVAPTVLAPTGATMLATDFRTVTNHTGRLPPSATFHEWPAPEPASREASDVPCRTRYAAQGGFTRQTASGAEWISPKAHNAFLKRNADSALYGELLEMLRPANACPNRHYRRNAEVRDELSRRIECLQIVGYISVIEMALRHDIPSLLVDGAEYFPGTVGANFYDIGFDVLHRSGTARRAIHEMPAEDVRDAGSDEVKRILASQPSARDMYSGFGGYFTSLQFHAHANGIQDAADMLDRITRDDSFGSPIVGGLHANTFLLADGYALNLHLAQCARKNVPTTPQPTSSASGICTIL